MGKNRAPPRFQSSVESLLASLVLESEQLSRAPLYDDDEIDHDKTDTFKPWSTTFFDTDILSLIHLSGDEDLESRLRTLFTEFADIFSNELPKEPADIPPFNLIVDDTKWKVGDISSTTIHPRTRFGSYLIIQMTSLSLLNSRYHHHAS